MTQPFTVLVPTPINDFNFVSSTLPENDFLEFDPLVTYNLGDRVILTTDYHLIYESLVDNNLGSFPPDNPDKWVEVGPTNRWAAFDESGGTLVRGENSFEFVVTGDAIRAMAFLELDAVNVRIRAENLSKGIYYDETFSGKDATIVDDWFDYFIVDFKTSNNVIVFDIPPEQESTYTLTVEGGPEISLGTFLMGFDERFGFTEYNARAGIIDFSRKETDQFGRVKLVKRAFSKRLDVTISMEKALTDKVFRFLTDLRATPVLWVGAYEQFETLEVYGFYRDFTVDIAFPTLSLCTLQIEGIA